MAMKYEIREAKTPNEGFTVYGGVREFVNSVDHEVVLCGPAETGKTIGALYKLHLIAMVVENAQMAIVRKSRDFRPGSMQVVTLGAGLQAVYGAPYLAR